jgi:hypothetical protein
MSFLGTVMTKLNIFKALKLLLVLSISGITACGGSGSSGSGSTGSTGSTGKTSHFAGQDCISCHKTGGSGESGGVFKVAGTVYKSGGVQTNATVKLYVVNTNTLVASLETDNSGNFYTTESVQGIFEGNGLVSGVDVVVEGSSGSMNNMPGTVTEGSCNFCHGNSNGNITAN